MFAVSTYEEVIEREKRVDNPEIVVFLFVKPTGQESFDIIKEFEYIHYNAQEYCSIYAIGYSDDLGRVNNYTYKKVHEIIDPEWYFSYKAFVDFKNELEKRIKWDYSGEIEVLVLQNNPGNKRNNPLNFQNYVAININRGVRDGYIDSFQIFMESLIRNAKRNVTAREAIDGIRRERMKIKGIIVDALEECKNIPIPVKNILKDKMFYRCANSMRGKNLQSPLEAIS